MCVHNCVLQCVVVCCSVLQLWLCVAQSDARNAKKLGWVIYVCALVCVAVFCSVLQCVAVCCSVLQCVAVVALCRPIRCAGHKEAGQIPCV